MQGKIPFAQFILNDIAANGAFLGWSLGFSADYCPVARKSLETDAERWSTMKHATDKDDWTYEASWTLFGYYARIVRGTHEKRFFMTARGELARQLLLIQDQLKAEEKAKRKAEKAIKKQKELDAQWWP